ITSFKVFNDINNFIEKYTGLNIGNNPVIYGDVFIFEYSGIEYSLLSNEGKGIKLNNLPKGSICIVKFKKEDLITLTRFIEVRDTKETKVLSNKPWNKFDLEVFYQEELIFSSSNISFIRSIRLDTRLKKEQTVPLKKIANEITLSTGAERDLVEIGTSLNNLEKLLLNSSRKIKKSLEEENERNVTTFIKPGEGDKANKMLSKELMEEAKETWIFDPYFTSEESKNVTLDWIHILANSPAKEKNVVFYSNDNSLDVQGLVQLIKQDLELTRRYNLRLNLWQTKSPIHDRFILKKNKHTYSGISIGTSLNSLERNHYCITPLNHKAAELILDDLTEYVYSNFQNRQEVDCIG
ncbi:MAG: hypothetical protein L0L86_10445, partial [Lactococcus lactis]|nr:hypothetical protein [Lactococcus lactis]